MRTLTSIPTKILSTHRSKNINYLWFLKRGHFELRTSDAGSSAIASDFVSTPAEPWTKSKASIIIKLSEDGGKRIRPD